MVGNGYHGTRWETSFYHDSCFYTHFALLLAIALVSPLHSNTQALYLYHGRVRVLECSHGFEGGLRICKGCIKGTR